MTAAVAAVGMGMLAVSPVSVALADPAGTVTLPATTQVAPSLTLLGSVGDTVSIYDPNLDVVSQSVSGGAFTAISGGPYRHAPSSTNGSLWWEDYSGSTVTFARRMNATGQVITTNEPPIGNGAVAANSSGFLELGGGATPQPASFVTNSGSVTTLAADSANVLDPPRLDDTSAYAMSYDGATGAYTPIRLPLDGSASHPLGAPSAFLSGIELSPNFIGWITNDPSGRLFHRIPRAGGAEVTTALPGDVWDRFSMTDQAVMFPNPANASQFLVLKDGGSPVTVTAPAGVSLYLNPDSVSDGAQLLLEGQGSGGLSGIYRVDPSTGVASMAVAAPVTPTATSALTLTGGRLWATDNQDATSPTSGDRVWSRDVTGASPGPETPLSTRVALSTYMPEPPASFSGNRSVLRRPSGAGFDMYDGGQKVYSNATDEGAAVSGPYAVVTANDGAQTRVIRTDGTTVYTLPDGDGDFGLFGSRLAYVNMNANAIVLVDLTHPTAAPVTIASCSAPVDCLGYVSVWGDYAVYQSFDANSAAVTITLVNLVTKAQTTTPSPDFVRGLNLNDGVVSWADFPETMTASVPIKVWNGVQGVAPVTVATDSPSNIDFNDVSAPISVDQGKMAWVGTDGAIRVAPVGFGGLSRPRLLGVAGAPSLFAPGASGQPAAWAPQFDFSKGLSSWTLTITQGTRVVRTITGGATPSGAVRADAWNGKDANGVSVPNGSYTWTLTGNALDGTGALAAINGTSAVSGTVNVATQAPSAAISTPELASTTTATGHVPVTWAPVNQAPGTTVAFDVQYRKVSISSTGGVVYGTPVAWFTGTTARSATFSSSSGTEYQLRVRAKDQFGRYGAWSSFKTTTFPVDDRSFTTGGTWSSALSSADWAGTYRSTSASGAYLYRGAAYASKISIVGAKAPSTSKFLVYIDGAYKGTFDSYRSTVAVRQVLYSATVAYGRHTVKIVNAATTGRKSLVIDAVAYAY